MRYLLLILFVTGIAAHPQKYLMRPLKIYTQDNKIAEKAIVALSMEFNVSMYPDFGKSCQELVSEAQIYFEMNSLLIISDPSGNCPKDLWPGSFIVTVNEIVAAQGTTRVNWTLFTDNLLSNPFIFPLEEFVKASMIKSNIQAVNSSTSAPPKEKENLSGLLVPWYSIALTIIFVVFLVAALVVLIVLFVVKKPSATGKKESKSKQIKQMKAIPEPKSKATMSKSENSSSKSSKGKRSPESSSRRSSKNIEKCSTKEERSEEKLVVNPMRSAEIVRSTDTLNALRSDNAPERDDFVQPTERSLAKRLEQPVTKEEFEYYVQSLLLQQIMDYCEDNIDFQVYPKEQPGFLFKRLNKELPQKPADYQTTNEMRKLLNGVILPGMTHAQHLRFHASFSCGRSYPDIMGEMLIAALGVVGSTWDSCPSLIEMEYAMINWLAKAMDLPEIFHFKEKVEESQGGGCFLETSTEAILTTVLVARQWKIRQLTGREVMTTGPEGVHYDLDMIHDYTKRLVFYASREAHSSIEKSCKLALVKCRVIVTEEKNDWAMTGRSLEDSIQVDQLRGLLPTYVMVSLGTSASGAFDDLVSILAVAKKYNLYVHVNAATVGMFWIEPKYRLDKALLTEVNSINVSLHKAGLHSASSAVLFVRERKIHLDAFSLSPATALAQPDLCDWGIHSTHKFKALKTWFVMSFYGVEGLRRYLMHVAELGEYFRQKVASHPNLKLAASTKNTEYGQFCFQYVEPGWNKEKINKATMDLASQVNKSNKLLVSHAVIGDEIHVIRVCTAVERVPKCSVDENYCTLCDLIDEFKSAGGGSQEIIADLQQQQQTEKGLVESANLAKERSKISASDVLLSAVSPSGKMN